MTSLSSVSASDFSASSPPLVQERGSLRTSGDSRSQFIGSSSGVYFVNRVRQAFAQSYGRWNSVAPQWTGNPSPEECILTDENADSDAGSPGHPSDGVAVRNSGIRASSAPGPSHRQKIPLELGSPPPLDVAKRLFMDYFQTWHRFFPFVSGLEVGTDLEKLYSGLLSDHDPWGLNTQGNPDRSGLGHGQSSCLARFAILQSVFNLAALHSTIGLPVKSRIDNPVDLMPSLLHLAIKGDIASIQALFALELLLVARMSLRTAATLAGALSRVVFLAGLHRCPVRYVALSADQSNIRKRLFWCVYVLDRYLSQALGHPLEILDSDVDVCSLAGPELHRQIPLHSTNPNPDNAPSEEEHQQVDQSQEDSTGGRDDRNLILAYEVDYYRLSGRALELFHKSIHVRSLDPNTVLSLRTDLDMLWNSLPSEIQDSVARGEDGRPPSDVRDTKFDVPAFFGLLHSQLRLLINRPWLALDPTTAEFQSTLQICVGISRDVITNLRRQRLAGCAIFWPGDLSATWMSGVILAFACHLGLYPANKSQTEIALCLDILEDMANRWPLAKNCRHALTDLKEMTQSKRKHASDHENYKRQHIDPKPSTSHAPRTNAPVQTAGLYTPRGASDYMRRLGQDGISPKGGATTVIAHAEPNQTTSNNSSLTIEGRLSANASAERDRRRQDLLQGPTLSQLERTQARSEFPPTNNALEEMVPKDGVNAIQGTWYGGYGPDYQNGLHTGNWDSGMSDIFGGMTWDSLLNVVNQDGLYWNGQT
ncbi:hypothetical protein GGR57DRAFT_64993 [Xylariaceae sp. FL1272]|nr:hypothetical protein GGR57DRAFT_64993 [Xylariaceae sp. FL1272]